MKYLTDKLSRLTLCPTQKQYASKIDSSTRAIHLNVWSSCQSPNLVKFYIIPLFASAKDSIVEQSDYELHVRKMVNLRIQNLERYCRGLPAAFNSS